MRPYAALLPALITFIAFAPFAAPPASAQPAAPAAPGVAPEVLDTARAPSREDAPAAAPVPPPVVSVSGSVPDTASSGVLLHVPFLSRLDLGGTAQFKAFARNITADADADKRAGFNLRRLRIDLDGGLGDHFGFTGQFRLEANDGGPGIESGYLSWTFNEVFGVKAGKLQRPFSQEALMPSKALYTVERGSLYQDFLERTTGYSGYDVGLMAYGGFEDDGIPVKYEIGVFNGKQGAGGYADQQSEGEDRGLQAKDVVFRLSAQPFSMLKAEAGLSTKAAEETSDPENFEFAVNTAYQAGLDFAWRELRLVAEGAWGNNHAGRDAGIISGGAFFAAFYAMGVWREEYSRGRASELVLKAEALDPDARDDRPNDGKLRYTVGANYFFTPRVSLLVNYGLLQPVTRVPGEDVLAHDLDVMWRMAW